MKIPFKIYKGFETLTEQRIAEVILHDKFIELIHDCDFEYLGKPVTRRAACLHRKDAICVWVSEYTHEDDPSEASYPRVTIGTGSIEDYIYVETMDEAQLIYSKIKKWLME